MKPPKCTKAKNMPHLVKAYKRARQTKPPRYANMRSPSITNGKSKLSHLKMSRWANSPVEKMLRHETSSPQVSQGSQGNFDIRQVHKRKYAYEPPMKSDRQEENRQKTKKG